MGNGSREKENSLQLKEYQREGVQFLAERQRALLFDECGIGKTVQALYATSYVRGSAHRIMNYNFDCEVLILCPASLIGNWDKEIRKWWDTDFGGVRPSYFNIHSYHDLVDLGKREKLLKKSFDVIIVDEAHSFKNWGAKRTLGLVEILKKNKNAYVWMLTATPATKRAADMHPMLSIMEPGKWGKFGDFCDKYCKLIPSKFGSIPMIIRGDNGNVQHTKGKYVGFKNTDDLKEALKRFGLRRTAEEVQLELPEVTVIDQFVKADGNFSKELADKFLSTGVLSEEEESFILGGLINKVQSAKDFIKYLEPPVIIFFWHRRCGEEIKTTMENLGFSVGIIMGGLDNTYTVRKFSEGFYDILCVSIAAGGTGLDGMQRASRCVFMEYPWSVHLYTQAVGRLRRIGQRKPVFVYNVIGSGCMDSYILERLDSDKKGLDKIFI